MASEFEGWCRKIVRWLMAVGPKPLMWLQQTNNFWQQAVNPTDQIIIVGVTFVVLCHLSLPAVS